MKIRSKDVELSSSVTDVVEKQSILRRIRNERRGLEKELATLSVEKAHRTYSRKDDEDENEEPFAGIDEEEETEDVEAEIAKDQHKLTEDDKVEYNRLVNLCIRNKEDIKKRKEAIEELLDKDTSYLTDLEKRDRRVKTKAMIQTMSEKVRIYKEHAQKVT